MNKKLILVAVPPASGKTVVSKRIAQEIGHLAYFDKDTLFPLVNCAFDIAGAERNMDSEFYTDHIRAAEYETVFRLAAEALHFETFALINAPFGAEVRDVAFFKRLHDSLSADGIGLVLIWVLSSPELCRERMVKRNLPRDSAKFANWEQYISGIRFDPPVELLEREVVDSLLLFDTSNHSAFETSLKQTVSALLSE